MSDGSRIPVASDLSTSMTFFGAIAQIRLGLPSTVSDYRTRPVPAAASPNIPGGGGADAPVRPAVHVFEAARLDLELIKTPSASSATS